MRLHYVEPDKATGKRKDILQKLVMVPNVLCQLANSEAVLDVYVRHHASQSSYNLPARQRKLISLAVSQFNDCSYCTALHTATAVDSGLLSPEECLGARRMQAAEPASAAILHFTHEVLEHKGRVGDAALEALRKHGLADQEIVEILAVIASISLANYTANVGRPELDFLDPPPLE